jgi:undecaprenyl-diphosphatase
VTSDQIVVRHPLRYPLPWVQAGLAGPSLLVLGVLVAGTGTPGPLDASVSAAVSRTPPWPSVALAVDWFGEPLGALLVACVLAGVVLLARRPRYLVLAVVAQASILVTGDLLKLVVGRTIHEVHLSYPSGHTAGAVAFVLVLALFVGDLGGTRGSVRLAVLVVPGLGAGLVAGWAQVTLQAHYLTDALGGVLLAFTVVPSAALVIDGVADLRGGLAARDGSGPR